MNTQQTYLQHHCDFIFPLKKQKEVSISSMNEPYTQTIELHWNFWPYICTMPSTLLTWMGSWQIRDSPMGCPSCFNLALVVPLIITHLLALIPSLNKKEMNKEWKAMIIVLEPLNTPYNLWVRCRRLWRLAMIVCG